MPRDIVINIYECGHHKPPVRPEAVALQFWFRNIAGQGPVTLKGENMLLITASQQCGLSIQPVDAKGNPAKVDGAPIWTVSDPAVLSLTVAEDGMSATVAAVGPIGAAQVNVTADADLGGGVRTLSGTLDVEVAAGEAVALSIATGTPTEQA